MRAGKQLDPRFAAVFAEHPAHFLSGLEGSDLTQAVLDAEPGDPIWLSGEEIDRGLSAIADFGDPGPDPWKTSPPTGGVQSRPPRAS